MGKIFIGFLMCIPAVIWVICAVVALWTFSLNCDQYLKRAADANTIEMAKSQLKLALDYMEMHGLTSGYCSIFLRQPKNDIGFWYNNIKNSKTELDSLPANASPLEKSNLLMKLRETLVDQNSDGKTVITKPDYIYQYPNNVTFFWLGWMSFLLFLTGLALGFYSIGNN